MQLKIITELLHLPNFQVVSVLEDNETSIHLYTDLIEPVAPLCSACGAVHHSQYWLNTGGRLAFVRQTRLSLCTKTGSPLS